MEQRLHECLPGLGLADKPVTAAGGSPISAGKSARNSLVCVHLCVRARLRACVHWGRGQLALLEETLWASGGKGWEDGRCQVGGTSSSSNSFTQHTASPRSAGPCKNHREEESKNRRQAPSLWHFPPPKQRQTMHSVDKMYISRRRPGVWLPPLL